MSEDNAYRHPAGRTCASTVAMLTLFGALLAMLGRKSVKR